MSEKNHPQSEGEKTSTLGGFDEKGTEIPERFLSIDNCIKFIKKYPYTLSQTLKYSADKLMMLLDNERLAALEDEFNEHPEGIMINDFIKLMESAINYPSEEKVDLVYGLIKLFNDIDINGDEHMEWSEFTQYIIDSVIEDSSQDKKNDNGIEIQVNERDILDQAYARRSKRYQISEYKDTNLHPSLIQKIVSIGKGRLLILEENAKKIKYYNTKMEVLKYSIKSPKKSKFETEGIFVDFAYNPRKKVVGVISSNKRIIFWETNYAKRLLHSHEAKRNLDGIWYIASTDEWILATHDFFLEIWKLDFHTNSVFNIERSFKAHDCLITDCIEITNSNLLASSSLDGKIKIWDLEDYSLLTELTDVTMKKKAFQNGRNGVRALSYTHESGGNMLSIGYHSYINVWSPDSSLSKSFVGRLEGHSGIVVCCKALAGTPYCISVDDKHSIRVWDLRSFLTIQMIRDEANSRNSIVTCMEVISNEDKFIVGGKRLQIYNNDLMRRNLRSFNDEIKPIRCEFNRSYKCLLVLTQVDMRVFDALTGKLIKVFTNLADDQSAGEMTGFCMGARERKMIVIDNLGLCRILNVNNGELIQKVVKMKNLKERAEDLGTKKKSFEISKVLYLDQEKMMVTVSCDSIIRIYNCPDGEDSTLLRELRGGHNESELSTASYNHETLSLVTGAYDGTIAYWNFENSKLEYVYYDMASEITSAVVAFPYKAILSTNSDGVLHAWKMEFNKLDYPCLFKIDLREKYLMDKTFVITTSLIQPFEQDWKEAMAVKASNHSLYSTKEEYQEAVYKSNPKIETLKKEAGMLLLSPSSPLLSAAGLKSHDDNLELTQLDCPTFREVGLMRLEGFQQDDTVHSVLKSRGSRFFDMSDTNEFQQAEARTKFKDKKLVLVTGDSKGFFKTITLNPLMDHFGVELFNPKEYNDKRYLKHHMALQRKDNVVAKKSGENFFNTCKKFMRFIKPSFILGSPILRNQWRAHRGGVVSVNLMKDLSGLISCGNDQLVKIWSMDGKMWSQVSLTQFNRRIWNFPYDWIDVIVKEIDNVFDVISYLENREIEAADRESITARYFYRNFIYKELFSKYQDTGKMKNKKVVVHQMTNRKEYLLKIRKALLQRQQRQRKLIPTLAKPKNNQDGIPGTLNPDLQRIFVPGQLNGKLRHLFHCYDNNLDPDELERRKNQGDLGNNPNDRTGIRKRRGYKFSSKKKFRIKEHRPLKSMSNFKPKKNKYNWRINSSLGESCRLLKLSTLRQMEAYQADIQKRLGSSNQVLRKTMKFHKKVEAKFTKQQNNFFEDEDVNDYTDLQKISDKIIAKKRFYANPNDNNPKIIKTKNKLYVI